MTTFKTFCLLPLLGSFALAAPLSGPGGPPGMGGDVTGSASVSLTATNLGGGLYSLYASATFSATVDPNAASSYDIISSLDVFGPDGNGGTKSYAGYYYTAVTNLPPGYSFGPWTMDTQPPPTTTISGTYRAVASLGAEESGGNAGAMLIVATNEDTAVVP